MARVEGRWIGLVRMLVNIGGDRIVENYIIRGMH